MKYKIKREPVLQIRINALIEDIEDVMDFAHPKSDEMAALRTAYDLLVDYYVRDEDESK